MPSRNGFLKRTCQFLLGECQGLTSIGVLVFLLIGWVVIGVAGYFLMNRLTETGERLTRLEQQVEEAEQKAEEAAQRSETAHVEALQAKQSAVEAARGRAEAEASSRRAEQATEKAREEARLANQIAQLAREEAERIRRERQEELDRLQRALSQIVETRRTALGLVMNLGNDFIQFDFDRATLHPENREVLAQIAGVLLTSKQYRVQIYGHTDDIGSEEYNSDLSERRARAVSGYLIEAGIDPGIISTKGFGKSNPLVTGTSAEARKKNRRVEIGIIDTVINYERSVSGQPD